MGAQVHALRAFLLETIEAHGRAEVTARLVREMFPEPDELAASSLEQLGRFCQAEGLAYIDRPMTLTLLFRKQEAH